MSFVVLAVRFLLCGSFINVIAADANIQTRNRDSSEEVKAPSMWSKLLGEQIVEFSLYTKKDPSNGEKISGIPGDKVFKTFNRKVPTKVIIHGWLGNDDKWYAADLKSELLPRYDLNVILVDWSHHGSKSDYFTAKHKRHVIAPMVAQLLDNLSRHYKVSLDTFHLLGHSLGAHISGIAGLKVTRGKIGRITGFDPAGVMFDGKTEERLKPESAKFVDVIHTCANRLGHSMPMGHVDFYPNGGTAPQPGCGSDLIGTCSHSRSYEFYIESLSKPNGFPAVHCQDWKHFLNKQCDFKNIVFLGERLQKNARGTYFFATNDKKPFAKGLSWV